MAEAEIKEVASLAATEKVPATAEVTEHDEPEGWSEVRIEDEGSDAAGQTNDPVSPRIVQTGPPDEEQYQEVNGDDIPDRTSEETATPRDDRLEEAGEEPAPKPEQTGVPQLPPQSPTISLNNKTISLPMTRDGDSTGERSPSLHPPTSARRMVSAALSVGSTTGAGNGQQQVTISSMVFVVQALETIAGHKEARKRANLGEAVQKALEAIKAESPYPPADPTIIFNALRLATETSNVQLMCAALDCIGKLISYSYFSLPSDNLAVPADSENAAPEQPQTGSKTPLIEDAIETVCKCFQGDTTNEQVQLQIIKALLAAVLNEKLIVHGAGLLKAVRMTYNIFLLSRSSANQITAQGTLTQMVHTVFERVKSRLSQKEARLNRNSNGEEAITPINQSVLSVLPEEVDVESTSGHSDTTTTTAPQPKSQEKITLESFENRKSFDDDRITDSTPTTLTKKPAHDSGAPQGSDEEDEIFIKDAFLVFRAMCKLSIKNLPTDQVVDMKSHGMRSKLLSLYLIHTILKTHMFVFISPLCTIWSSSGAEPTGFIQAVKQYLCLSLSRNAASPVTQVFEVCCEIFWLILSNMRYLLKIEIEVFLKEIYLAVLENRNASVQQKQYLTGVLERLCCDPRALVELYLNYDCDRSALENIFQRIIEDFSKVAITPVQVTDLQQQAFREHQRHTQVGSPNNLSLPPSLSSAAFSTPAHTQEQAYPTEYALKQEALQCLVDVLRSMVSWSQKGIADLTKFENPSRRDSFMTRDSVDTSDKAASSIAPNTPVGDYDRKLSPSAENLADDPDGLHTAKQRKTELSEGVRQFNYKPKRGIKFLVENGFIKDSEPQSIAEFLLSTKTLNKAMIGEYLGEGDRENIEIMHAFVDLMDFTRMRFVDALRTFLQSFRLPGEGQKIDRLMLKFAERYITDNPNAFANADTAYVLAYSVIMLNTDLHTPKLKGRARMTKEEFIRNNRGINDKEDLPEEYLIGIYTEIQGNEIVLEDERTVASLAAMASQQPAGIAATVGQALAGRDVQKELYVQASEEMANKTEQLFKSLLKAQRKSSTKHIPSKFIAATSYRHVGPMFEVSWMSFLSALSAATQDPNAELETLHLCMEGFKLAIRIACLFDLETARIAFVSALAKFTHLNNLSEMKTKHMEALRILLELAQTEGNLLKSSWRDILTCVSQLERFQLISSGVDETSVPDVTNARFLSVENSSNSRASMQSTRPRSIRPRSSGNTFYLPDVAQETRSTEIYLAVDRIFANSANLSGEAIIHFVKALSEVSWQEIQSSGQSENPRMFALQKLVEISYYNMNRIRVEWSSLWAILGEHFNQVGCHNNTSVVNFALDSLRQLSMRFLEKEELPHFRFQKDFLRPFEYVMANNNVVMVKDMVLRCLSQMIQARASNIRSGWRTMFAVFTLAAGEAYDSLVTFAFDNVKKIYKEQFRVIITQSAFSDMIVCLTSFAKNQRFQKISLQAIETLKTVVPKMLSCPECPLYQPETVDGEAPQPKTPLVRTTKEDPMVKFWFPVLFSFHDILMTGDDLEVRTRALNCLFDALVKYGSNFPPDFWDSICRELLFPIFLVLKSKSEMTQFNSHEAQGMWLSTTMIQALRNLISLFTHYFDQLERMLDGFLDLLITCICQENDTIARIGSSCLQQLILQSVKRLRPEHWEKIVSAFVQLFETTTADQLFSATSGSVRSASVSESIAADVKSLSLTNTDREDEGENALKINGLPSPSMHSEEHVSGLGSEAKKEEAKEKDGKLEDYRPAQIQQQPVVTAARRRFFNRIITKCVLQLLMIETVSELFSNDAVYNEIPSNELLRLMKLLQKSYWFAKKFNKDKELRMRLWREGFMKQPPNLLKQESNSAATYISILFRMYHDERVERRQSRDDVEEALIPLCFEIIREFVKLDDETQQRNIQHWRPVVVDVLEGYSNFPADGFDKHINTFYPLAVEILSRDISSDVRLALQSLLRRVGDARGLGKRHVPTA